MKFVNLVLFVFTEVNSKKTPAITTSASYSLGSCPLLGLLLFSHDLNLLVIQLNQGTIVEIIICILPVYTDLWLYVCNVRLFPSIHRSECISRLQFSYFLFIRHVLKLTLSSKSKKNVPRKKHASAEI